MYVSVLLDVGNNKSTMMKKKKKRTRAIFPVYVSPFKRWVTHSVDIRSWNLIFFFFFFFFFFSYHFSREQEGNAIDAEKKVNERTKRKYREREKSEKMRETTTDWIIKLNCHRFYLVSYFYLLPSNSFFLHSLCLYVCVNKGENSNKEVYRYIWVWRGEKNLSKSNSMLKLFNLLTF